MKKHLTSFELKIIAIIAMTIDHIGFYLFPDILWLRAIGRIAFPLFAFLCAESFRYTKNKHVYALRMILCGAIYTLIKSCFIQDATGDIFLTLGLGFLILWCIEERKFLSAFSMFVIGILIPVDYTWYGLFMIPVMYYLKEHKLVTFIMMSAMNILIVFTGIAHQVQYYSIISLFLIWLYNNEVGCKKFKCFFYIYYPIHIAILIALAILK